MISTLLGSPLHSQNKSLVLLHCLHDDWIPLFILLQQNHITVKQKQKKIYQGNMSDLL